MFVGKFDASIACDASFRSLTNKYWCQPVHSRRANVVGCSQSASCGQEARIWWIVNAACVVWKALLSTIWPVSHHLSHISSFFSIQAGEKQASQPMRCSPQMGTAAPHKVPRVHPWHLSPPRRFYNTLHLHKVLLRGKKKKKKAGPVNEWPLKRILPLVFCGSHGLVWFIIPQQEVNKDTFEHRCIQIHRRKKKFKARHFFWNLRKHVVAEGSLTGTFVFSSFIQAASLMRQTITTSTLSASALRLLWRNLQNFSKVRTVPVIPTG